MLLCEIIDSLTFFGMLKKTVDNSFNPEITSIGCDSREVHEGQLFFVKGVNFKKQYLESAIKSGAVCYVSEVDMNVNLPVIIVKNIRKAMPVVAKIFYNNPASKYLLTGVTGTKGKTTVTHMLRNVMSKQFGKDKVGIISTNGAWIGNRSLHKTGGSTPETFELYNILNQFAILGAKAVCMEVSSQALQYDRVNGIHFNIGVFLNLDSDHISPSEHHSFDEYKKAKKRMLTLCETGIVNIDDNYSDEFISASTCESIISFSVNKKSDIQAQDILLLKNGSSFKVNGDIIEVGMPGIFNVYNALAVYSVAQKLGCSINNIKEGIKNTSVEGRMEVYERNGVTVIVDYAHNKVSFEAVFEYLEEFYPSSRKICLFGCQGNKALDRRRELPQVACKYSDIIIITSDDPENEDPLLIMDEVEKSVIKSGITYKKIEDREEAVQYAISISKKGDVVFLAGKGREVTQKVHGHTVEYKGDMPTAIEAFDKKGIGLKV